MLQICCAATWSPRGFRDSLMNSATLLLTVSPGPCLSISECVQFGPSDWDLIWYVKRVDCWRSEGRRPIRYWHGRLERCYRSIRSHTRSKKFCYSRSHTIADIWRQCPWGEVRHGASVCDVDGGIGDVTIRLAKQFLTLQLILQLLLKCTDDAWWHALTCPRFLQSMYISFRVIFTFDTTFVVTRCM
jgi:hypothetical protein